jgi:hypothetical protein
MMKTDKDLDYTVLHDRGGAARTKGACSKGGVVWYVLFVNIYMCTIVYGCLCTLYVCMYAPKYVCMCVCHMHGFVFLYMYLCMRLGMNAY